MLEIYEVGDSTYIEWGDPIGFLEGSLYLKLVFTEGKMPWRQIKENRGKRAKGICYFKWYSF